MTGNTIRPGANSMRRWYWFAGVERWDGGFQVGLGLVTVHWQETVGYLWWFHRD